MISPLLYFIFQDPTLSPSGRSANDALAIIANVGKYLQLFYPNSYSKQQTNQYNGEFTSIYWEVLDGDWIQFTFNSQCSDVIDWDFDSILFFLFLFCSIFSCFNFFFSFLFFYQQKFSHHITI